MATKMVKEGRTGGCEETPGRGGPEKQEKQKGG